MANFSPYLKPRVKVTLVTMDTNQNVSKRSLSKFINFMAIVGQDDGDILTAATILKPDGTTYNSPAAFIDDFARKLNSLSTNTYVDTIYGEYSINELLED